MEPGLPIGDAVDHSGQFHDQDICFLGFTDSFGHSPNTIHVPTIWELQLFDRASNKR
jgi:hypothetical protein